MQVDMNSTDDFVVDSVEFKWSDYLLFAVLVVTSTSIGIYFGFFSKKQSVEEYFGGNRQMKVIPVTISLIASILSGQALVALPADVYTFGATIIIVGINLVIAISFASFFIYPVLYKLELTSIYEYMELRFDRRIRILTSLLYTIGILTILPIIIYIPAVSMSLGTKLNVHYFTIFFSIICIFYTAIGGLKAVIWTDVLQMIFLIFTSFGFIYLGLQCSGGFQNVLDHSYKSGRLTIDFDLDPTKRDTFWSIGLGASTYWIQYLLTNQAFMQKCFCLPKVKLMRTAMILFSLGYCVMLSLFAFFGLIIYVEFKDCDPFKSGKIKVPDQISMHYILHVTKEIPAIAGLFIVAIFSASFSSFSAYLNAVSCTIYKDFLFNLIRKDATEKFRKVLIQLLVVFVGTLGTLLVLVVENAGSLLAIITGIGSLSGGPMFGIFILALFSTKANSRGTLFGAVISFVIVLWMFLGAQYYQRNGYIKFIKKPLSIESCDLFQNKTSSIEFVEENQFTPLFIYRISHNYYTIIGSIITVVSGLVISCIPGDDLKIPRKEYLSPLVHWLLPKETNKYKEVALVNLRNSID